ncbi:putative ribonuclease H-like domain-containing protein [Tanacetum coccineum]
MIAQGYTQEEGIDYDEVFAPIARIEAIRLFLAYASFMGFMVYQMDVKSTFLYGTIEGRLIMLICSQEWMEENVTSLYETMLIQHQAEVGGGPKDIGKPKRATEISQSSGPILFVTNKMVTKEWEDIMERAATTASSLEVEQDNGNINGTQSMATLNEPNPQGTGSGSSPRCQDTILGGVEAQTRYALTKNLTIYVSLIQQFWQTATTSTPNNGEMEITTTIDGEVKIVTEASIMRHLKLEDSNGVSNLPTTEIFKQLALMGYVSNSYKLTFQKTYIDPTHTQKLFSNMRRASKGYTGVDIPLFSTMLVQGPVVQGEGSTHPVESHYMPTNAPSTSPSPNSPTSRRSPRQETKVPQPSSLPYPNVADEAASTGVDVRHG